MPTTLEKAFDRGVRPVAEIVLSPRRARAILSFKPAAELQTRIEYLAERSTEGRLTKAERAEYEGYVHANKFVAILRRLARQRSNAHS